MLTWRTSSRQMLDGSDMAACRRCLRSSKKSRHHGPLSMTIKKSLGSLTFEESQYIKHHKSKTAHFVEMLHDLLLMFVSVLSLRKDSLLLIQAKKGKSDRTLHYNWCHVVKILAGVFFFIVLRLVILTEFVTFFFLFFCVVEVLDRKKWESFFRKISKEAHHIRSRDATQYTSKYVNCHSCIIFAITWGLFVSPPTFPGQGEWKQQPEAAPDESATKDLCRWGHR